MKRNNLLVILLVLLASCSGQYKGIPRAELLSYQTQSTYGSLYELSVAYAEAINEAVKEDTLHPGMYADYGVALALMGHKGVACRMLNAEVRAFPESKAMVNHIKKHLMPEMMEDTMAVLRDTADLNQLLGWAYDSLTAMMTLPQVAPVVDSSDTAWLRKQTPVDSVAPNLRLTANQKRELLVQQQQAALMARQAHLDSVEAAKKAKIEARKQAQSDKEKEKKQKEKAKKHLEKEKKQQAKIKQKERERQAAERKKQQEQQAAERKVQREKEAAERKAQREQEAAERKVQREIEAAKQRAKADLERNNEKGGEE